MMTNLMRKVSRLEETTLHHFVDIKKTVKVILQASKHVLFYGCKANDFRYFKVMYSMLEGFTQQTLNFDSDTDQPE